MTRTVINISKRYSLDLRVFIKRVFQVVAFSLTVTLLLSPPSAELDVGHFLALLAQRLFGTALTSSEGIGVAIVIAAALFGAYKIYPLLAALDDFEEGDTDGLEFCSAVDREQGRLRLFSAACLITAAGYLMASAGSETSVMDTLAAGFLGLGLLTALALVFVTTKVARCEPVATSGYAGLAQRAYHKYGRLRVSDLAKLMLVAQLR